MVADRAGARVARRRQRHRRVVTAATVAAALVGVAAVAAVVLVVTNGGDDEHASTAPRVTRTSSSSSSSSTTTTLPVATTAVPKSPDPVVALAQQYDGRYVGTFTNNTFRTTGGVSLELRIDPTKGELSSNTDFDGDLFGGGAKEVRRISSTVKLGDPNAAITTQTKAFGPVTGRLDENLQLVLSGRRPRREGQELHAHGEPAGGPHRVRRDLHGHVRGRFHRGRHHHGVVRSDGARGNEVETISALSGGGG